MIILSALAKATETEPLLETLTPEGTVTVTSCPDTETEVAAVPLTVVLPGVPWTAEPSVVPDGNGIVMAEPASSAPPAPTLKATVYWAKKFFLFGFTVTSAAVTVLWAMG